jgi:hypothetical protein
MSMPSKPNLKFVIAKNPSELKNVRIPGTAKTFDQLTISELVQLRPGDQAADSYNVNAVGSDVTISTSSLLAELAQVRGQAAVHEQLANHQVQTHLNQLGPVRISDVIKENLP